ncbi:MULTISPECIES: hypothetical protein [unclassified Methylocaldum]|jgi:hypothetical protein|uniref:hypothetical protein n=1 Tax=unclassified Methylocaldum TaxID=2622260 RepID=UPI00098BC698|nr:MULTISPECIES: hypothetical protein [unclassified Methylocaldum]MBP1151171.1 hypothetical protein [Methylocaldum sp. RMAD-M]
MTKNEFINLMQYPREWVEWGMLPDELLNGQIAEYEPGSERASQHYRNGAFHFWLRRGPSKDVLLKLARLSFLDPDPLMADWLRKDYIAKAENADGEVLRVLRQERL